ncbi:MAG: secretin N-terminal domain-containing protein [Pseudomonadota bacterium]
MIHAVVRLTAVLLLCLSALARAETEVIATQRPAEELLPVLQPLAAPDVSVQAFRGQLVLSGPAERIAQLRAVLAQLDRPARNLRVSVRQRDAARRGSRTLEHRQGQWSLQQRTEQAIDNGNQQLVMAEGTVAMLALDREIPVLTVLPSGASTTAFLPLGNVLELEPQLSGDQVRLEIRQRQARMNGDVIDAAGVQSVLMLMPGEWTALGAVDSAGRQAGDHADSGGRVRLEQRSAATAREWQVMVELLP